MLEILQQAKNPVKGVVLGGTNVRALFDDKISVNRTGGLR
jgi:hypothetical protein